MRVSNRPRIFAQPRRSILRSVASASSTPSSAPADRAYDSIPSSLRACLSVLPRDTEIVKIGARHAKIIATIGPSTSSAEQLLRLAAGGVNLVRLNMCHGDYDWHANVLQNIREINRSSPFVLGTIIDLGSLDTVRLGEFSQAPHLQRDEVFTLTAQHLAEYPENVSEVSSDAFLDVARVGDLLQVQGEDGKQIEMVITDVTHSDVICRVTAGGQPRSRGTITIRGKSLNLKPSRYNEDLNVSLARAVLGCPPDQLEFAVQQRVEYVALSFVESSDPVVAVRRLLRDRGANIGVIAKVESSAALRNLDEIITAADAVMVARGDLGAAIHYAKIPYWQDIIVQKCLQHGKPSLVSTHFLESMVLYPTPTRAEVTDITEAAKQRTDALILTAETASGRFPFKAVQTMNAVLQRMEQKNREKDPLETASDIPPLITDPTWWTPQVGDVAENIASAAATLANERRAAAILVFTQKGLMANLTSRHRPHAPIYAFTATPTVRNKLSLMHGVRPFRIDFEDEPEETIQQAMEILKQRQVVREDDLVVVLADVLGGRPRAREDEIRRVFNDAANGSRYITASEVRNALRRLSLKVSDKTEAQLGMRDVDLMDAGMETSNEQRTGRINSAKDMNALQFDFEKFRDFALQAQEIVHTIQMRYVA